MVPSSGSGLAGASASRQAATPDSRAAVATSAATLVQGGRVRGRGRRRRVGREVGCGGGSGAVVGVGAGGGAVVTAGGDAGQQGPGGDQRGHLGPRCPLTGAGPSKEGTEGGRVCTPDSGPGHQVSVSDLEGTLTQ